MRVVRRTVKMYRNLTSEKKRRLKKAQKEAEKLKKRKAAAHKRAALIAKSKIRSNISRGDDFYKSKALKTAYSRYLTAWDLARNYDEKLLIVCEKRLKSLKKRVQMVLDNNLTIIMEEMEGLLVNRKYEEMKDKARQFNNNLRDYEWAQITEILTKFQEILLEYWERVFQQIEKLADEYYSKKQYDRANVLYAKCINVAKEFRYGPHKTHLIQVLMKYEEYCEAQITTAQIGDGVEKTRDLMRLNKKHEALVILDSVYNLDLSIPTQFRDRARLRSLRYEMNQLRDDYYKNQNYN